jgi:hypothetical protein
LNVILGGYLSTEDIDRADEQNVQFFMPPKPPRNGKPSGSEFQPKPTDSPAVQRWRQRMGSDEGKEIYQQRCATVETVNADFKGHRGLTHFVVRGLHKAQSLALWCALAYNIHHFGGALLT